MFHTKNEHAKLRNFEISNLAFLENIRNKYLRALIGCFTDQFKYSVILEIRETFCPLSEGSLNILNALTGKHARFVPFVDSVNERPQMARTGLNGGESTTLKSPEQRLTT